MILTGLLKLYIPSKITSFQSPSTKRRSWGQSPDRHAISQAARYQSTTQKPRSIVVVLFNFFYNFPLTFYFFSFDACVSYCRKKPQPSNTATLPSQQCSCPDEDISFLLFSFCVLLYLFACCYLSTFVAFRLVALDQLHFFKLSFLIYHCFRSFRSVVAVVVFVVVI